MLDRFNKYIKDKNLFNKTHFLIVAVSGGIDSVCLCHLLHLSGYSFAIAHCNFGLRGRESDLDEEFVKELAERYKVPFFVKSFDTTGFAEQNRISIQMAARSLRYQWFEELLSLHKADKVLTAHHRNDSIETFFLNLTRGTGIAGLHGIQARADIYARPLLFTTREEIKILTETHGLEWREDSSNKSTKYKRNFLRHNIIPQFSELNPNFTETITETIEKIALAEAVFGEQVEHFRSNVLKKNAGYYSINIEKLKAYKHVLILLYEVLKTFHFNFNQCKEILSALDSGPGKKFISKDYILIKDRSELVITRTETNTDNATGLINSDTEVFRFQSMTLYIRMYSASEYIIKPNSDIVALDMEKLRFPLTIRYWQQGDHFQPLGMTGTKKVSDLLINSKVPLNLKSHVCVLLSDEKIAWVIGQRLDNRFKITPKTQKVMEVQAISDFYQ